MYTTEQECQAACIAGGWDWYEWDPDGRCAFVQGQWTCREREAKWSQPPHGSGEGFDAASDLWWSEPPPKWQQQPDPNLPGLLAHNYYSIPQGPWWIQLADDWECRGGEVTEVRWWGNYELDYWGREIRGSGIDHFRLAIHTCYPGLPWCVPSEPPLWEIDVPFTAVGEAPTGVLNIEGSMIYRYSFVLPEPFWQDPGQFYWLDLIAMSVNATNPPQWRWQEANRSPVFLGHAPAAKGEHGWPDLMGRWAWQSIIWPEETYSDLAFEVISGSGTMPTEVNKVVADDFISDGRPIEALRWWGSYLDAQYEPGGLACNTEEEQYSGGASGMGCTNIGVSVYAQSFSPQHDFLLCKVSVAIDTQYACDVTLYVQDGPEENATVYTQVTTTTTEDGFWFEFDVPDYPLLGDQSYYIRLEGDYSCGNCWCAGQEPGGDPYPRGQAFSNGVPLPPDQDFMFVTYTYGPITGPYVVDGWFISFHHDQANNPGCPPDLLLGDPHPTVLGVYFAPVSAVQIITQHPPVTEFDCLGHQVYQYAVDLAQCCLLCSQLDPRPEANPPDPAQPGAFLETRGLHYWLDIQAVTGVTWVPPACTYEDRIRTGHLPSPNTPDGHFWGWHTSPGPAAPCEPMNEACSGRIVDFQPYPPDCWDYGDWATQPWLCPGEPQPVHVAFDLLTSDPQPCPTCPGDLNNDGVVNGLDIQGFVSCVLGYHMVGVNCACADFNCTMTADLGDLPEFIEELLNATVCPPAPHVARYWDSGCLGGVRDGYPDCGEDVIELSVEPETLHVLHRNATYNCCPDDIVISMWMEGNVIHLTETEVLTMPCDCMCCYNVEAIVEDLEPGPYTVEFCWNDWETSQVQCVVQQIVIPPRTPYLLDYSNSGCLTGPGSPRGIACEEDDTFEFAVEPGTLHALHRDAEYNCCPDDIAVSLTMQGNVIRLDEEEILTIPCFCICCYNVESTVADLAPGLYTVEYCWFDYGNGPQCHTEEIVIP